MNFNVPVLTEWLIAGVIIYCILWAVGWVNPRRPRALEGLCIVMVAWPIIGVALIAVWAGYHGARR